MEGKLNLYDVVALTADIPEENLKRGEMGAIVFCHTEDAFEVEFVAKDGHTYALLTLNSNQLLGLRERKTQSSSAMSVGSATT